MGALRSLIICFAVFSKIPMPYIDWEKKDMKYIFCFLPFSRCRNGCFIYRLKFVSTTI